MRPIRFPQANRTLTAPVGQPDVRDLPVWTGFGDCVSCWELSWADRLRVLFGKPVWLIIHSGDTQPPVALQTRRLFGPAEHETRAAAEGR